MIVCLNLAKLRREKQINEKEKEKNLSCLLCQDSRANEFWNPLYFSCATNSSEVCKALTRGLINQDIRQNGQDSMFIISEKNCEILSFKKKKKKLRDN